VHQGSFVSLAVLDEGNVEILEVNVGERSPIVGTKLRDVKMPKGALLAAILRGDHVIVPGGESIVCAGDVVILIARLTVLEATQKLFAR
jgi:trk system potassium uptake protein TrkA